MYTAGTEGNYKRNTSLYFFYSPVVPVYTGATLQTCTHTFTFPMCLHQTTRKTQQDETCCMYNRNVHTREKKQQNWRMGGKEWWILLQSWWRTHFLTSRILKKVAAVDSKNRSVMHSVCVCVGKVLLCLRNKFSSNTDSPSFFFLRVINRSRAELDPNSCRLISRSTLWPTEFVWWDVKISLTPTPLVSASQKLNCWPILRPKWMPHSKFARNKQKLSPEYESAKIHLGKSPI